MIEHFGDILKAFADRERRNAGDLARLTGLPKQTIVSWLEGRVKSPRNEQDVINIAAAFHLNETEANRLLQSAKHRTITQMLDSGLAEQDEAWRNLLRPWLIAREKKPENLVEPPHYPAPFQVPPGVRHFIGRSDLIVALKTELLKGGQICVLRGMGGVGKTTLAARLAYDLRDHFTDGVLWANLDGFQADEQENIKAILKSFAFAYGFDLAHEDNLNVLSRSVNGFLASKRALIVLDNAYKAQTVELLLPPGSQCTTLVTTHHRSWLSSRGISFEIAPFGEDEGLDLLKRIVDEDRINNEVQGAKQLVTMVGGLPLALKLIASTLAEIESLTLLEYYDLLLDEQSRLEYLTDREAKDVRASFELSYQRLPDELKRLFTMLSLFAGPDFGLAAVAKVAGLARGKANLHLGRLYTLSLIERSDSYALGSSASAERDGEPRYTFHPLLRLFSRHYFEESEAQARLIAYFIQFVQSHAEDYEALDIEINNILPVLVQATDEKPDGDTIQSIIAFYPYLRTRGRYAQARQLLQKAIGITKTIHEQKPLLLLLTYLGQIAHRVGDNQQAESCYTEALHLAQQAQDTSQIGAALRGLGAVRYKQDQRSEARRYFEEALLLVRQNDHTEGMIALQNNLGLLATDAGDYLAATQYYEAALALARSYDDQRRLINVLQNMGVLLLDQEEYAQAKVYLAEGLQRAETTGDPELICRLLGNLSQVAVGQNEFTQAYEYVERGLHLARKLTYPQQLGRQLYNAGYLAHYQANYDRAVTFYQEALALTHQYDFVADRSVILNALGNAYLALDNLDEAEKSFSEAYRLAEDNRLNLQMALSLFGQAQLAQKKEELTTAVKYGQQSLQLLQKIHHKKSAVVQNWLTALK